MINPKMFVVMLAARPAADSDDHGKVQWALAIVWLPALDADAAVCQAKEIATRVRYDLATEKHRVFFAGDPQWQRPLTDNIRNCISALGYYIELDRVAAGKIEPNFETLFESPPPAPYTGENFSAEKWCAENPSRAQFFKKRP